MPTDQEASTAKDVDLPPIGDPTENVALRAELHPRYARPITISADAELVGHQVKRVTTSFRLWDAKAKEFEFLSDEGPSLGGKGEYPSPLQYLLGGIGT
jgi:hypothetical protein